MSELSHISDKAEDNRLSDPVTVLRRVIEDIEKGEIKANRLLILCLDDTEDAHTIRFRAANISCSQMLSLMECAKILVLEEMGYL